MILRTATSVNLWILTMTRMTYVNGMMIECLTTQIKHVSKL